MGNNRIGMEASMKRFASLGDMADGFYKACRAQEEIQKFIKAAARDLASAARLSSLVTGDAEKTAVEKWAAVLVEEAKQILGAKMLDPDLPQIEAPKKPLAKRRGSRQ